MRRRALTDDDLRALQADLCENPKAGNIVAGLGGARKVRVGLGAGGRRGGKRGGGRAIYFYDPSAEAIYLLIAYNKRDAADLTVAGKKIIRELLSRLAE